MTEERPPTTVILVDDHAIVRRGVAALLRLDGRYQVVAEASNGEEALQVVSQSAAELMIIDLSMPRLNGLETIRRLNMQRPTMKLLVLSMYDDEQFVTQALAAGASGYLLKHAMDEELFRALGTILAGGRYISHMIKTSAQPGLAPQEELTSREREVLQLIVEGHTTPEIAGLLHISPHTANRHRANLMQKLDVHNQAELIALAVKRGLVLLPLNHRAKE